MEDFLQFVLPIVGLMLAALLGQYLRKRRALAVVDNMPEYAQRKEYLRTIKEMRKKGSSQPAIKAQLVEQGLLKGVADVLINHVELQQDPDLLHPKSKTWGRISFNYPGNWKVEPLVAGSEEHGISVDGTSGCGILLVKVIDTVATEKYQQEFLAKLKDVKKEPVKSYHDLPFSGTRHNGIDRANKVPTYIDVLTASIGEEKIMLVEIRSEEDEELDGQGLDLVGTSMRIDIIT